MAKTKLVQCKAFMSQTLYIHSVADSPPRRRMVSVEGSRVSLDLSPAEALELADAIKWAATNNGDSTGGPGEEKAGDPAGRTG